MTIAQSALHSAEHSDPVSQMPAKPTKGKSRLASAKPVLEQLFHLYPHLFGAHFVPLKRGIFQELLSLHPGLFGKTELRNALSVHTRSGRYLQCVARGLPRHDLQGQAVEPMAPEHVILALVELFQRRQARSAENLSPALQRQMQTAYEASGLSRQDYLARLDFLSEQTMALLTQAIAASEQQRARLVALRQAFAASGKNVDDFAADLGLLPAQVQEALQTRADKSAIASPTQPPSGADSWLQNTSKVSWQ